MINYRLKNVAEDSCYVYSYGNEYNTIDAEVQSFHVIVSTLDHPGGVIDIEAINSIRDLRSAATILRSEAKMFYNKLLVLSAPEFMRLYTASVEENEWFMHDLIVKFKNGEILSTRNNKHVANIKLVVPSLGEDFYAIIRLIFSPNTRETTWFIFLSKEMLVQLAWPDYRDKARKRGTLEDD
jgi:hypothetical protein